MEKILDLNIINKNLKCKEEDKKDNKICKIKMYLINYQMQLDNFKLNFILEHFLLCKELTQDLIIMDLGLKEDSLIKLKRENQ